MAMIRNNPARMAFACILTMACASCDAAGDAPAAADPSPAVEAVVVDALPLRRGYYVRTDDECGTASNATLALVWRDGIDECDFAGIERIGESRYRVGLSCAIRGAPPGHEHERDEYTGEYEILAEDRYRVDWDGPVEFRFCPQESLPEGMQYDISHLL